MKRIIVTFLFLIGGLALSHCAVSSSSYDDNQTNLFVELPEETSRLQLQNSKLKMVNSSKLVAIGNENENGSIPKNCAHVKVSGVHKIKTPPYQVYCDAKTQGGNWTVVQRRMDGSVDFYLPWVNYTKGFGSLRGEFFIGLENLHLMTTYEPQELLIVMEDFENQQKYAQYNLFAIGNENEMYSLQKLGNYSGDAGDSLSYHKGKMFSTYDRSNDENNGYCAHEFQGAWWYGHCHRSNLNGLYLGGAYGQGQGLYGQGVVWSTWREFYYSLKFVEMMIRPLAK